MRNHMHVNLDGRWNRVVVWLVGSVLLLLTVACTAVEPEVSGQAPTVEVVESTVEPTVEVVESAIEDMEPTVEVSEPEAEVVEPEVDPDYVEGELSGTNVFVDELVVEILESFPVQANLIVRGNLANPCVDLRGISAEFGDRNTFLLRFETYIDPAKTCMAVLDPFERIIALEVEGLEAGTYTVASGNVSTQFTLDINNFVGDGTIVSDHSKDVITIERTACFGFCPVYTLTIYGDGRVVYEGTEFVDVTGQQTAQINPEMAIDLIGHMVGTGYFEFADEYTQRSVSDLPSTITSLTTLGRTKRIERYHGDENAPPVLTEIEVLIDQMAQSEQWTGVAQEMPIQVGMPNPASENCVQMGGTLEFREDENGGQVGICVFPDGKECEEWALFNGECAPNGLADGATDAALHWTSWQLLWGDVATNALPLGDETPIRLDFDAGGLSGMSGCNNYFGMYSADGSTLSIYDIASTMMACDEAPMALEQQYLDALATVEAFAVSGDRLMLYLPNGELQFGLVRSVEVPPSAAEELTMFVGATQVDCVGVAPQTCLLVRYVDSAEWEYFYDSIGGFEWQAGYEYELRVNVIPVENPPADGSSLAYELIEIVNQTAVE